MNILTATKEQRQALAKALIELASFHGTLQKQPIIQTHLVKKLMKFFQPLAALIEKKEFDFGGDYQITDKVETRLIYEGNRLVKNLRVSGKVNGKNATTYLSELDECLWIKKKDADIIIEHDTLLALTLFLDDWETVKEWIDTPHFSKALDNVLTALE